MSGARYRAINMGPVPNNYNSIFEYMANNGEVGIWQTEFDNGGIGEQFKPRTGRHFRPELFTEGEQAILAEVTERFKGMPTSDLIDVSHREKAWQENEKERKLISYKYGFELGV